MSPEDVAQRWSRYAGPLLVTGGGQDLGLADTEAVDRAALAARRDPSLPVAVVSASALQRERACQRFLELGARSVRQIPLSQRAEAEEPEGLRSLREAGLIYIASGEPFRLVEWLQGSPALGAIMEAGSRGAVLVLAGESAPAAGASVGTPSWEQEEGLGWLPGAIFQPHCSEHQRFYYLLWWAVRRPELVTIGLDERTGLLVGRGQVPRVVGERNVYLVDPRPGAGYRVRDFPRLAGRGLRLQIASEGEALLW